MMLTPTHNETLTPIEHRDVLLDGSWTREHHHRIKLIQGHHGFLPHGLGEADAISKLDKLDKPYVTNPVIKYLERHSQYHNDVQQAREAVVDQFTNFAGNALNEIDYSWSLMQQLGEYSLDDSTTFNDLFLLFCLKWTNNTGAHLTSLARHTETEAFLNGTGRDPLVKKRLIDELDVAGRVQRIRDDLGQMTAPQVMELAHHTHHDEIMRLNYWYRQLQDVQQDSRIREKAANALLDLDIHLGASKKEHHML